MKVQVLAIILLVSTGMVFAQNAHRGNRESGKNNNRGSVHNTERRTYTNPRNEIYSNNRQEQHHGFSANARPNNNHSSNNIGFNERNNNPQIGRHGDKEGYRNTSYVRNEWKEIPQRHDRYSSNVNSHYSQVKIGRNHDHWSNYGDRRMRYDYQVPVRSRLIWTTNLCRDFRVYYPEIRNWRYPIGYSLSLIPAYNACNFLGEVATIYGKVLDAFYDGDNDQYILSMDDQHFSIIIPGKEAREFSNQPENYFLNQNIAVTGYVMQNEGVTEIEVRNSQQISIY